MFLKIHGTNAVDLGGNQKDGFHGDGVLIGFIDKEMFICKKKLYVQRVESDGNTGGKFHVA